MSCEFIKCTPFIGLHAFTFTLISANKIFEVKLAIHGWKRVALYWWKLHFLGICWRLFMSAIIRVLQFNSIYWFQNAVIAEKLCNSHKIGVWGLIESLNNVGIHASPTRVQSWFENVDRGRSNNESWQLFPRFNDPHGESGLPSIQPEPSVNRIV